MTYPNTHFIPRILGIDPTITGFAYAVLGGPRVLIDWAALQMRSPKHATALERTALLIARFRPHLIAVEDVTGVTRRGERAKRLIRGVEMLAMMKGVKVRRVSRVQIETVLGLEEATKYEIARVIAERFPELAPRLPRVRKPWMSEDERMNVFDAVGLAIGVQAGPPNINKQK
jgi:uncharacterized membrane protein